MNSFSDKRPLLKELLARALFILRSVIGFCALSSLIYSAAQQPLGLALHGILWSVIEFYQECRDTFFGTLGIVLSGVASLIAKLFDLVLPSPLIPWSPWIGDAIIVGTIIIRGELQAGKIYERMSHDLPLARHMPDIQTSLKTDITTHALGLVMAVSGAAFYLFLAYAEGVLWRSM